MRCNIWKVMLVLSALLIFAFSGELAAQTITYEQDGRMVYYGDTLHLTATVSGGSQPDTVLYAVESGDGGISPDSDTTTAGVANSIFTASDSEEDVIVAVYLVSGDLSDTLDADSVTVHVRPAPETLTLTSPGEAIVPNESLTISATLISEDETAVEDTLVDFSVVGDGNVSPSSDLTDDFGVAVTELTAGSSAGPRTIRVAAYWSNGDISLTDTVDVQVVNAPDDLVLLPATATLALSGSRAFQTRVTRSGTGVGGLMVYYSLSPGLGSVAPLSGTTNASGYDSTTYTASTASGVDTLIVSWTDEELRLTLADTSIITINPGAATSLNVTPVEDTVVVVTDDVVLVAELWDNYNNHVNATSGSQVSFSTSGLGTFGTASVNGDGCIECAYTTDDSMVYYEPDTVTVELLVNETKDFTNIYTYGGAPATINIYASDSTVWAGGSYYGYIPYYYEYFWFELEDQYGNPSCWSDYYDEDTYGVAFTVSAGGGTFDYNTAYVNEAGEGENWYYSDTIAVVRTITGTCGAATDDIDITQIPDWPTNVVLAPDSIGIAAGTDTVIVATMSDEWRNHVDADDSRFGSLYWGGWTAKGDGDLGTPYVENHNWKARYYSYPFDADTAWIYVWLPVRSKYSDTVVVYSAEPGDLHHFDITLLDFDGESFDDHAFVSDGSDPDTSTINAVMIEAQDQSNIRLWTYTNPDTVTLTLNGSSAGESQVVWYILDMGILQPIGDTAVGLTALVPPGFFGMGITAVGVCNQVAETVTITATDTSGHAGTSPELTWLPIEVASFRVALEGGVTEIHALDDTVNMEITALDMFGNTTGMGLPLNVVLSANRPVEFLSGEMELLEDPVSLTPIVATAPASDLVLTVSDYMTPSINGKSDPITVLTSGIEDAPVISSISAKFGSGDISYSVADGGAVEIKVYDKAGREVAVLVDGVVKSGYYQASLKGLNLASDVYFVVMKGPGINKGIKVTLIK
jgi:hypothetical protein